MGCHGEEWCDMAACGIAAGFVAQQSWSPAGTPGATCWNFCISILCKSAYPLEVLPLSVRPLADSAATKCLVVGVLCSVGGGAGDAWASGERHLLLPSPPTLLMATSLTPGPPAADRFNHHHGIMWSPNTRFKQEKKIHMNWLQPNVAECSPTRN